MEVDPLLVKVIKMKKKDKEESFIGGVSKSIGFAVIIFLLLAIPYSFGKHAGETVNNPGEVQLVTEEPCEYKDADIYFKGYCSDVHELIDLEIRRNEFDEFMDESVNGFKLNCEEFISTNLYNNMKNNDEFKLNVEGMSYEEFMDENIELIVEMCCNYD